MSGSAKNSTTDKRPSSDIVVERPASMSGDQTEEQKSPEIETEEPTATDEEKGTKEGKKLVADKQTDDSNDEC